MVSADGGERVADSCVWSRNRRAGSRGGVHRAGAGGSETKATDAPTSMNSSRMTMCTGWNGAGRPSANGAATTTDERDLGAEVESDRAPQLRGQAATALDRADDRRVGVVDEHEVGRLTGEIGSAPTHGDAHVRCGERRRVVDAVAGDGDDLASVLEDPDEPQLVLGRGAGDDGLATQPLGELVVVEGVERRATVQDLELPYPGLAGGRGDRRRVVAADDDRPHTGVGERRPRHRAPRRAADHGRPPARRTSSSSSACAASVGTPMS